VATATAAAAAAAAAATSARAWWSGAGAARKRGRSDGLPSNVTSNGTVQITLLHFNDWHVRVESTKGSWCGLCTPYDVEKGEQEYWQLCSCYHLCLRSLQSSTCQ
jgi:2',3'-cyclic-nucleotide 2'-phosphodiesterase (5'-nucleotidase family)